MIIAIDFDGTCVAHAYPEIGHEIGAPAVLRALAASGHQLILWTVRSGEHLAAAEEWFVKHEIPLYGVNKNPQQSSWSASPKCHANLFIDDLALGAPLLSPAGGARRYIDWRTVALRFIDENTIDLTKLVAAPLKVCEDLNALVNAR
jgi:hypothetical protein